MTCCWYTDCKPSLYALKGQKGLSRSMWLWEQHSFSTVPSGNLEELDNCCFVSSQLLKGTSHMPLLGVACNLACCNTLFGMPHICMPWQLHKILNILMSVHCCRCCCRSCTSSAGRQLGRCVLEVECYLARLAVPAPAAPVVLTPGNASIGHLPLLQYKAVSPICMSPCDSLSQPISLTHNPCMDCINMLKLRASLLFSCDVLAGPVVLMLCVAMQDAINRVQSLEASGELTGVMDDRGKVTANLPLLTHLSVPHGNGRVSFVCSRCQNRSSLVFQGQVLSSQQHDALHTGPRSLMFANLYQCLLGL